MKLRRNIKTDLEDAHKGTCVNCEKETWVRRIETYDMMIKGLSRGFIDMCFICHGPHYLWKGKTYGDMRSPVNIPFDETPQFLEDYFKRRNDS